MKKCFTVMGAALLLVGSAVAQEVPKVEGYLGYNYVHFNPATNISSFSANGGSGQFIFNFNKWISGVADLGAVHNSNFAGFSIDNTTFNYLFGPRISIRKWSRFTPYVQTLFGGAYYTASAAIGGFLPELNDAGQIIPGQPITARVVAHQNNFAMVAGGGIDIKINRHLSFRPAAVDYYMTRFSPLGLTDNTIQDNIRYSAGISFLFGGEKHVAPPPPQASRQMPKQNLSLQLMPSSTEVCPGDTVTVNPSISGASPDQLKFVWYVNGQPISQGHSFSFGTAGREPGTYKISLALNGANFNPAQAETSITVKQYMPPTGTVSASPAQVEYGDKATLASNFQGQCGKCAIQTPTYTASEGSVNGDQFDSTGVQFSAASNMEQRKTVTITANASDCSSTGTATTTVDVVKKAVVAPVRLPDVLFSRDSSRVNNCGKRVLLEQLRAYVDKDPTGTVVLVGNSSPDEKISGLDMKRAMNAAAVITAGTGVCMSVPQSQVMLDATGVNQNGINFESGFCGASVRASGSGSDEDMRRVVVWFVPSGGQTPAMVTNLRSAESLSVSGLGCPK